MDHEKTVSVSEPVNTDHEKTVSVNMVTINRILNRYWEEAKTSYQQLIDWQLNNTTAFATQLDDVQRDRMKKQHVFLSLVILRNALEGVNKTPDDWAVQ